MDNEIAIPTLPDMTSIWQQTLNWTPTDQQQLQFQRFYELILESNRQINLTRITEPLEFWEKHLWDSLRGIAPFLETGGGFTLPDTPAFIDIGTGAGFPGVPVAIALPDCCVTLLDSTQKKIHFLEKVLPALNLTSVKTVFGRSEKIGQQPQYRQMYDVALIRAVSTVSVCAEYALPLLKQGGLAIIYRGHWTEIEATALENAVAQLGGIIETIAKFTTPWSQSMRHCLYIRKIAVTPTKYPRAIGIPTQRPL